MTATHHQIGLAVATPPGKKEFQRVKTQNSIAALTTFYKENMNKGNYSIKMLKGILLSQPAMENEDPNKEEGTPASQESIFHSRDRTLLNT
jgi:hypothetical protein